MDCSPPGFSVHGLFQARILEWVAISFSYPTSLGEIPQACGITLFFYAGQLCCLQKKTARTEENGEKSLFISPSTQLQVSSGHIPV